MRWQLEVRYTLQFVPVSCHLLPLCIYPLYCATQGCSQFAVELRRRNEVEQDGWVQSARLAQSGEARPVLRNIPKFSIYGDGQIVTRILID